MAELKNQRTDIYPQNVEKAAELARALNMTATEMVNYLIESADIQQLTKISFTDAKTKKQFSIVRTNNGYRPDRW